MDHLTTQAHEQRNGHLSAENAAPTFEQNMAALAELGEIIERRIAEIDALREQNRQLMSRKRRLIDAMENVCDQLQEDFDTIDGSDGQPLPNKAMRLAHELKEAIYGPGGY